MLSARAGDEARVEGLEAGADDYLVKPFSARELLARVRTHLQLGQLQATADLDRAKLCEISPIEALSSSADEATVCTNTVGYGDGGEPATSGGGATR